MKKMKPSAWSTPNLTNFWPEEDFFIAPSGEIVKVKEVSFYKTKLLGLNWKVVLALLCERAGNCSWLLNSYPNDCQPN